MATHNCHVLHLDKSKNTAIVGYIGEPHDTLTPGDIGAQLVDVLEAQGEEPLFVNIVALNVFGLRINEQRAIIAFVKNNNDHTQVKTFLHHFNTTEDEIMDVFNNEDPNYAQKYLIETPGKIVEELLIDAMLASIHPLH